MRRSMLLCRKCMHYGHTEGQGIPMGLLEVKATQIVYDRVDYKITLYDITITYIYEYALTITYKYEYAFTITYQ